MSPEAAPVVEAGSESLFSSLVSFFVPTAHAEAPANDDGDKDDGGEDGGEEEEGEGGEEGGDEEEEEEEPEDQAPAIRDACTEGECRAAAAHFKHCSEKVEAGKGWEHEDCVEEMFHMMHCVDACAAPKLFAKLA